MTTNNSTPVVKLPYVPPVLTDHGDAVVRTLGAGGNTPEFDGTVSIKH
jgi:hypothetical protein